MQSFKKMYKRSLLSKGSSVFISKGQDSALDFALFARPFASGSWAGIAAAVVSLAICGLGFYLLASRTGMMGGKAQLFSIRLVLITGLRKR